MEQIPTAKQNSKYSAKVMRPYCSCWYISATRVAGLSGNFKIRKIMMAVNFNGKKYHSEDGLLDLLKRKTDEENLRYPIIYLKGAFGTTTAKGRSPHSGCGTATTAASATSGWPIKAFSRSTELIHSPPELIKSCFRSTIFM